MKNASILRISLALSILLLPLLGFCENELLDSLRTEIQNASNDEDRIKTLGLYAWELKYDSSERFLEISKEIKSSSSEINYLSGEALGSSYIGVYHYLNGNYNESSAFFTEALGIHKSLEDSAGIARCYNYLGLTYDGKGDYTEAINMYLKSLRIKEALGNKIAIANTLNNIGVIYNYQSEYNKALSFFERCLSIYEELENDNGIAQALNNIGLVYDNKKDLDRAIDYYLKSLEIEERINANPRNIALSNNNLGSLYSERKQYDIATYYYEKALEIYEKEGSKSGIALVNNNMAEALMHQGNYNEARERALVSLKIAKEIESKDDIKQAYHELSRIEQKAENYNLAFDYQNRYFNYKDSIYNLEKSKEIAILQSRFELEKQQAEKAFIEENIAQKKNKEIAWIYHGIFTAVLVMILILTGFNIFKLPKALLSFLILLTSIFLFFLISAFFTPYLNQDLAYSPLIFLGIDIAAAMVAAWGYIQISKKLLNG